MLIYYENNDMSNDSLKCTANNHHVFYSNLNIYMVKRFIFQYYMISQFWSYCVIKKNVQFSYTVSIFLHMLKYNVDFCKNEPNFMPLTRRFLLLMICKIWQFLFHMHKIWAIEQKVFPILYWKFCLPQN